MYFRVNEEVKKANTVLYQMSEDEELQRLAELREKWESEINKLEEGNMQFRSCLQKNRQERNRLLRLI